VACPELPQETTDTTVTISAAIAVKIRFNPKLRRALKDSDLDARKRIITELIQPPLCSQHIAGKDLMQAAALTETIPRMQNR
jgi:hypothetical protein